MVVGTPKLEFYQKDPGFERFIGCSKYTFFTIYFFEVLVLKFLVFCFGPSENN